MMYSRQEPENKMIKVTKLDKRHSCYRVMKYHVEVTYDIWGSDNRIAKFKELRNWCWEVFGPGTESKWIVVRPKEVATGADQMYMESTTRWAWQTEFKEMRLYFKDDETLSAFMFQWS